MSQSWTKDQTNIIWALIWVPANLAEKIRCFSGTSLHPLKFSLLCLKPLPFYCFILVNIYIHTYLSPTNKDRQIHPPIFFQPRSAPATTLPLSKHLKRCLHFSRSSVDIIDLLCCVSVVDFINIFFLHNFTFPILLISSGRCY